MRKIIYFVCMMLLTSPILAQDNIADARAQALGSTVTITGVITAGGELGNIRYLQDETAGITVFDNDFADATKTGDEISITGQLSEYNGLLQVVNDADVNDFSFEVLGSGNKVEPTTLDVSTGFTEAYEGMLLQFKDVFFEEAGGTFATSKNYVINGDNGSGEVRIDSRTDDIAGETIPDGAQTVVGVLGEFKGTYQLLPRYLADLGLKPGNSGGGDEVITIAEARKKAEGETVSVTGIVTTGAEFGGIRYIQDKTAGVGVFVTAFSDGVSPGDEVVVKGQLTQYNELLEIVDNGDFSFEVKSSGNDLPEPKALDVATAFQESYEGQLIRVDAVTFADAGGTFAGATNYTISDATESSGDVRIDSRTDIVDATIPSGETFVIGIMGQFRETYQLLPRSKADLDLGGVVNPPGGGEEVTIAEARQVAIGGKVTVRGIVTNGDELGVIRYIQDETAGIAVYAPDEVGTTQRGDSILITGAIEDFNGLLEIKDVTSVEVLSTGNALPAPLVLSANELFQEDYEGQLVRVENVQFIDPQGTFSRTSYPIRDNTGEYQVYINNSNSDIIDSPVPIANLGITGIMGQFQANYQLLPRLLEDIDTIGDPPIIVSALGQSDITSTSFNVDFETQNEGNTIVSYGLTPELELGTFSDDNPSTDHSITLEGLEPATIYYVQASSQNPAGDESQSLIQPMITASLSTGNIDVYFNRPVATEYATIEEAKYLEFAFDDSIRAYIKRAKYSIDMAFYTIDNMNSIIDFLQDAGDRGVRMRFVVHTEISDATVASLPGEVTRRPEPAEGEFSGLMHNKIMIIDADSEDPNDPLVWTGATNFTNQQLNTAANNMVIIQDQSLAKVYTLEFEEMLGGTFGAYKKNNTPKEFNIGGKRVELYFSPSDNVNPQIIRTAESAEDALYFSILSFTRPEIANAILDQANFPDYAFVGGLFDKIGGSDSIPFAILNNPLFDTHVLDSDAGYQLHHKYMIVDPHSLDKDPLVLTGSHNWSNGANLRGDENTLIIHDANIANQYYQEWVARYLESGGTVLADSVVFVRDDRIINQLQLYPNPTTNAVNVTFKADNTQDLNIYITDITGRVIYQRTLGKHEQEDRFSVDVSMLPSGVYLLHMNNAVKKFIINGRQ